MGLHRLRGHLGWVLLTSHVGSFAAANCHGGQQAPLKLTSCLPTGLALHHWELAWTEHQARDGERTFPKRGRRDPNHISMAAPEHSSALGSGQAVANLARGAQTKQSNAALSLLPFLCCPFSAENQPSPKIQGLSPDPPFCHPKADPYFCMASRELKTFGILLHQFQSQHQFSSCDESPQELEFKNEQSGRFFPHYNFFFPPGKVISQKFCWTKASPIIVNAAILIYSSQGSDLFFQQVA